jgi:hypothetical protein
MQWLKPVTQMCAGSRAHIAKSCVTDNKRTCLHTYSIELLTLWVENRNQSSAQVPCCISWTFHTCFQLSYQIILKSTYITKLDNRNIYVTFIIRVLMIESVVSVPFMLHCHQNMLHKIAQYVTPPFVALLRSQIEVTKIFYFFLIFHVHRSADILRRNTETDHLHWLYNRNMCGPQQRVSW